MARILGQHEYLGMLVTACQLSSVQTEAFCFVLNSLSEEGTWAALKGLAVTSLLPSWALPPEPLPGRDRQCLPGCMQSVNLTSGRGLSQTEEPPVGVAQGLAFLLYTVTALTVAPGR